MHADRAVAGGAARPAPSGYHRPPRRCPLTVWFTVELEDRPGALARLASALAERSVNITGIVGVAEDTGGALMLTTSDAAATRAAFDRLGLPFEEHEPGAGLRPDGLSVADVRRGRAEAGGRDEAAGRGSGA